MAQQQPPFNPQPGPGHPGAAPVREDPGKTLGIVGLIGAFLIPLVGLIISIVARSKSKAAGFTNGLATGGIIVSIVAMILGLVISAAVIIPLVGVFQKCQELGPGEHRVDGITYTCG